MVLRIILFLFSINILTFAQENLIVPFSNPGGVTSQNLYQGMVTIQVSGVGESYATRLNDAFYIFTDFSKNPTTPYYDNIYYHLIINNKHPQLQAYNKDHNYTIFFDAGTIPIRLNFKVSDGLYSDNYGQYEIIVNGGIPTAIYFETDTTQTAGEEFWVNINVGTQSLPVTKLFSVNFVLHYDETFAGIVQPYSNNVVAGEFLGVSSQVDFVYSEFPGDSVGVNITRKPGEANVSGYGTIARIKFYTLPDTPHGTHLFFDLSSVAAKDSIAKPVELTPKDTSITIQRRQLVVWPGDTNNDGIVNQVDVLPIGLAWGITGDVRTNGSSTWMGQPCISWIPEHATYADAMGDGIVGESDILPIGLNWKLTHNVRKSIQSPIVFSNEEGIIRLIVNSPEIGNDKFYVDIQIENVHDLFGIALNLKYPQNEIDITSVIPENCWSANRLFYYNNDTGEGVLSLAISQKADQEGLDETDSIVRVYFNVKDNSSINETLKFTINDAVAFNSAGENITLIADDIFLNKDSAVIPEGYRLYQNYPNPFNNYTTIKYEVPIFSRVELKIYNILGGEVVILLDENKNPGVYECIWDGKDKYGKQVTSGIFFYEIITMNFSDIKKCLFVK